MMTSEKTPQKRRTQSERRAETKARLLAAARSLFVEKGFAETGTPELVRKAGVTRGALYHHFEDKTDLFRALAQTEAQAVGHDIEDATRHSKDAAEAMELGTSAYFESMAVPGRAKILLADAPSILGFSEALALAEQEGTNGLKEGLRDAIPGLTEPDLAALTNVMSAAFDRAALEIAQGADRAPYLNALFTLVGKATA